MRSKMRLIDDYLTDSKKIMLDKAAMREASCFHSQSFKNTGALLDEQWILC